MSCYSCRSAPVRMPIYCQKCVRELTVREERNRIADIMDAEAGSLHPTHSPASARATLKFREFAERLRKGEV